MILSNFTKKIEITNEKILQLRERILDKGSNSIVLIFGYPKKTREIIIGNTTIVLTGKSLIHKCFGIDIWIDDGIPENSIYFLDKKEYIMIEK